MDIALDPFPFGGGTTTCDALWMGVPVVSLRGRTAVGRGGVSLLSNVELADLVADTVDDYVAIAAELAGDLPRIAQSARRDARADAALAAHGRGALRRRRRIGLSNRVARVVPEPRSTIVFGSELEIIRPPAARALPCHRDRRRCAGLAGARSTGPGRELVLLEREADRRRMLREHHVRNESAAGPQEPAARADRWRKCRWVRYVILAEGAAPFPTPSPRGGFFVAVTAIAQQCALLRRLDAHSGLPRPDRSRPAASIRRERRSTRSSPGRIEPTAWTSSSSRPCPRTLRTRRCLPTERWAPTSPPSTGARVHGAAC